MKRGVMISLSGSVAVIAMACSTGSGTPAAPGATPAATAVKSAAAARVAPRVVHLVRDPVVGKQQTIAKYWDYGRDAPFQVTHFSMSAKAAASNLAANYSSHASLSATVRLPVLGRANLISQGGANWRLQQAEGSTADASPAENDPKSDLAPAPAGDHPATDDAQLSGDGSFDLTDDSQVSHAADLDPMAQSADEAGDDPAFPTIGEAAAMLSGPHQVTIEQDDAEVMSNSDNLNHITDVTADVTLDVKYDHAWQHFEVTDGRESCAFAENPDGTFLVNGVGAANVKAAVDLLQAQPVIKSTSNYILALLCARIARLAPPAARNSPDCSTNAGNVNRYHVAGAVPNSQHDQISRTFVVIDALLKRRLKSGQ